jgi:hypothetical protein
MIEIIGRERTESSNACGDVTFFQHRRRHDIFTCLGNTNAMTQGRNQKEFYSGRLLGGDEIRRCGI